MYPVVGPQHPAIDEKECGRNCQRGKNHLVSATGRFQSCPEPLPDTFNPYPYPKSKGKKTAHITVITLSRLRFRLVEIDDKRSPGQHKKRSDNQTHLPLSPEMGDSPNHPHEKGEAPKYRPVNSCTLHIMLAPDELPSEIAEVHLLHLIGDKIVEITRIVLIEVLMHWLRRPPSRPERHIAVLIAIEIGNKGFGRGWVIFVDGRPGLCPDIDHPV